ncbi:hypothetical protein FBY04_103368 [Pseudomonas sp. SJZ080]|nr:hypothetical protein FBY04_103368 [Pseudomonas sp. SJZ080]
MSARIGWLAGRHRQQAGSYEVSVYPREQVGWQGAIASKPAPARSAYVGEDRLVGRPPSPASRRLRGQRMSARIGWLAGRHRQQAGACEVCVCRREQVGWQGAIASKPAPARSAYFARTGRLGAVFASKPAPTGIGGNLGDLVGCEAAIASKPAPTKADRRTPASHHSSGRALARLQLLILIHPPLREAEWRGSSGEWRAAPFDAVELIACRCQRSQPEGDAPG